MSEVIAAAKANLNRTPLGMTRLYASRLDHLRFLQRLEMGKL